MADAVIDVLEVIDVQKEDSQPALLGARPLDRGVEQYKELAAIRQMGQRILLRELAQLLHAHGGAGFEFLLIAGAHLARRA